MSRGHDYALYNDVPNTRLKLYAWLGVISALAAAPLHQYGGYLISMVIRVDGVQGWVDSFVASIGVMTIFAGLSYLFRTYLWRYPLAAPLYLIAGAKRPPVIDGSYQATVTWFDPDIADPAHHKDPSTALVTIIQYWDSILILFDFPKDSGGNRAGSHSEMAIMESGLDTTRVSLQYTYRYRSIKDKPEGKGVDQVVIHGTSLLSMNLTDGVWRGEGHYYCDNGTSGRIEMAPVPVNASWWRRLLGGVGSVFSRRIATKPSGPLTP